MFEAIIVIGLLLIIGSRYNSNNSLNSITQLSIFAFGAQKLLPSIQQIYASITAIKHSAIKTDSLLEIIEEEKDRKINIEYLTNLKYSSKPDKRSKLFNHSLELNSIYFRYSKAKTIY